MQPKMGFRYAGRIFVAGNPSAWGPWRRLQLLLRLRGFFKKNTFDVVIDFRVKLHPWAEAYLNHFVWKETYVCTLHSALTHLYFPKMLGIKLLYRKSTQFVCINPDLYDTYVSRHGIQPTVLGNPIAPNHIRDAAQMQKPGIQNYWLAIGRLDANKQYATLLQHFVASDLPRQGIQLVIAGDGPQQALLKQRIRENSGASVRLMSFQNNPYSLMQGALGLVICSQNEGLPMVALEALSLGCPVVAFDCPTGPRQLIRHGHNGLLIEPQNWDELLKGMQLLSENENLRQQYSRQAPGSVAAYHVDQIGPQWLHFLQQLPHAN